MPTLAGSDISIEIKTTADTTGLDQISSRMKNAGKKLTAIGSTLTKRLTLPIIGAAAGIIKFGADFDKSMTESLAIMGDVTDEMRTRLERAARDVAKTTKFSAKEAADSYFFLASAGLDAAQSIEALPKVAQFAQAGAFDMALATDLLTDAQSALGLTIRDDVIKNMENMIKVSDVLVKANTLANATVQQFSEALTTRAGASLRAVNKDVEEGVAVLAAFADRGIKGALAGTQLAIVMRDLQTKAIDSKEEFKKLGVSVFDSSGEMNNMADIFEDLEHATKGMSDEQRKATFIQLGFSDRSQTVLDTVLGTSKEIRKYEEQLRSAGGITEEVANKQLQTFWEQLKLIKDNLIDVALTLWNDLQPVLVDVIVPALKDFALKLQGLAEWFGNLDPKWKLIIAAAIGFAAVIGPILIGLGLFITLMGAAAGGLTVIGGLLAAITAPFWILIAVIALLAVAWTTNFLGIRDKTKALIDFIINEVVPAIGNFVKNVMEKLNWLKENWAFAIGFIIGFVATLPTRLPILMFKAMGKMVDVIKGIDWLKVLDVIYLATLKMLAKIQTAFENLWKNIKAIKWAELGKAIVNTIINLINGLIKGALSGLPGGGAIANKFQIPRFQEGGVVPGPIDKPKLIVAHGGEEVIPRGGQGRREIVVHQTNIINKDTDMIAAMRELGWLLST